MTKRFRIMTFNLRVSAADDGPNSWPLRWPHVQSLIRDVQPDILGAQECMHDQLVALMAELHEYVACPGPDTMCIDCLPIRNPIFAREAADVHPLIEGVLALNETGVIGDVGWDAGESRLAYWARLPGWVLVNVHFDAWGEQARYESAQLLTEFFKAEPVIILIGDLNCTPDSPPITHFREAGYTLAKDSLPPDVDRRTFTKFEGKQLAELDYVLVRGATVRQVTIPRPRTEAPFPSDHDPVVVEIKVG